MTQSLSIKNVTTLLITPVAKGRPRFDRQGHAYTPAQTRRYEAQLRMLMRARGLPKLSSGPLKLTVRFYLAKPKRTKNKLPCVRPDIDNFLKAFSDAADGVLWKDDGQVCEVDARKLYDLTGQPRIEFQVTVQSVEGV